MYVIKTPPANFVLLLYIFIYNDQFSLKIANILGQKCSVQKMREKSSELLENPDYKKLHSVLYLMVKPCVILTL